MNRLNVISVSFCLLSFVMLTACSDVNPINTLDDSIDEDKHEAYLASISSSSMSESDKCYYGTSIYGDQWCCTYYGYRCGYVSSSSRMYSSSSSYRYSSSSGTYYLTSAKTMKLSLTSYKQVSKNWDGLDNAGDPEVSFVIYTYSDGVSAQTITTPLFIDLSGQRSWMGTVTKTYTINRGVDKIKICPKVIDEDVSSHDNYSSGKCFTVSDIGYLNSYDIQEQKDSNSDYELKWEWYLY